MSYPPPQLLDCPTCGAQPGQWCKVWVWGIFHRSRIPVEQRIEEIEVVIA